MNARQLEVFRAVMRNRSLTAAAEALHVSQPAVSKLLRHFETQIGYTLFERLGGRLVPTAEAQLLYRDADRIFREIEVLRGLSDRIRDKQLGLLRVGASAPPTFALLPFATERFRQRNPGLRVVLQTMSAEAIEEHITLGNIDLGVIMRWSAEAQLRCESLGKAAIVALMRPNSPLAELSVVTPADLVDYPLISYSPQTPAGKLLDQAFQKSGVPLQVQIEMSLSIAAFSLVQHGLGIALVDGLVPWRDFGDLVVRPFQPDVFLEIVLARSALRPQTRYGREYARDLRAAVAALSRRA
ncbi:LysR family transcriptional regulator [Variovorax guangxiensis]|uniref:LysR family transcriptional regulator n=1 Tax=Variovorax guangxiensis TaxID=1775474 RepID=UPI002866AC8B|nr:LysR family transcriptional regulator [Variovorax guangxiensis]MDR6860152.1 DNA-binding transcriptional LysR family regulator [Variovorax guangxiensis]